MSSGAEARAWTGMETGIGVVMWTGNGAGQVQGLEVEQV